MSKYKKTDGSGILYDTIEEAIIDHCAGEYCVECPICGETGSHCDAEICCGWVRRNPELAAELMGLAIIQERPEPDPTANPTEEAPEEVVIEEPVTYKVGEYEETYMEHRVISGKVLTHWRICEELNRLYERKNHDYGDSFHQSFEEEGMAMARIRLGDKLSRFKALTRNGGQQVADESIRDTLIDLANYAIMTVMEMDGEE